MKHGSMRKSTKQNNSPPCGSSKTSQIQWNLLVKKSLGSKWWPVSSAKLVIWRLLHLSTVGQSNLSSTPQFPYLNSSEKFEKWTREEEPLFTMAMRALTHRLKSALYWQSKTSNWWVIRRTALTWRPMTSFCSSISKKKCVVDEKMMLKRSKTMFWRCLNRSGKTNTNDSRTSKLSEYRG